MCLSAVCINLEECLRLKLLFVVGDCLCFDLLAVDFKMNQCHQSEEDKGTKKYVLCLNYALLISEMKSCFKRNLNLKL